MLNRVTGVFPDVDARKDLTSAMAGLFMSAAEIDQVIRSSRDDSDCATGNAALDKAKLAKRMIDNGYEAEEIERVLKT